jgi:serine/threonine-protein kinase
MFLEEARLAARLTHPNIVQTNEVGSDGSRHFMIMEYLDGRSLYRVVKHLAPRGGLPIGAHLRIIAEALLGLHYAHEFRGFDGDPLGIVHRDVSPLNLLVTFDGQSKVLDFGIAKALDSSLETQAGILKGRIAYMAPEQASGGKVDRRADIYAAGVMIWEAAARRRLWRGMTDVEILSRTLGEGPPRLRSIDSSAPADLDTLCARAMASDPADRYPTAMSLLSALDEHLACRDDAMSMREIGALVNRAFAPERQRLNAVIDDAVARIRQPPWSGVMPVLQKRPFGSAMLSSTLPAAPGDGIASISSLLSTTPSGQTAERSMQSLSALRSPRPTVPDTGSARPTGTRLTAIATAILVVACLVLAVGYRNLPVRPAVTRPPAGPEPTAAPTRADPRTVDLVEPAVPTAKPVSVESRPAAAGVSTVPRYASGPRWSPQPTGQRSPKSDTPESVRPGQGQAEVTAGATARPEVDPGGGRAPLRPIVTSNPYGVQ